MKLFRRKKIEEELFAGIDDEPAGALEGAEAVEVQAGEESEPVEETSGAVAHDAVEEAAADAASEVAPSPADEGPPGDRTFFDLPSERLADYRPPGAPIASNRSLELKPILKALAVIAVVGLLITGIIFIWPSSNVRVPTVVGKNLEEAMDVARAKGFDPSVKSWSYSDRHPDGIVLDQDPKAMQVVGKGIAMSLMVSKGPRPEEGVQPDTAAVAPQSQPAATPYAGKSICIDPGGQQSPRMDEWSDPGMTRKIPPEDIIRGTLSGNADYVVNLDIATKLKDLLEKDGIKVVMTRTTNDADIPNTTRADIASNAGVDLFVRVYCGWSDDPTRMGVETLYPAETSFTEAFYEKSKAAALFVQSELLKSTGVEDLGAAAVHDLTALNWSKVPAIQTDAGFLSSPRDDSLLAQEDFRWKVAWGLRNGIIKYLTNP